jgi:hypothetical protein
MQKLLPIGYQKQNAQLVGIDPKEKNVLINIIKDKNLTMVPFFMLPMQQSMTVNIPIIFKQTFPLPSI